MLRWVKSDRIGVRSTCPTEAPPPGLSACPCGRPALDSRAFEAEKSATRALERKQKRLKQLEQDVAQGEAELEARRAVLRDDPGGDLAKLARLAKEEQELSRQVDAMMSEWMSLSAELAGASPEAAS